MTTPSHSPIYHHSQNGNMSMDVTKTGYKDMTMAYHWVKLHHELIHDAKVGRLSDSAFRRFIEMMCLAGEQPEHDGTLPDIEDLGWLLRVSPDDLQSDLAELERGGMVEMRDGSPFLKNFEKRQAATSTADRVRLYRERQRQQEYNDLQEDDNETETELLQECNDGVTNRYTDIDKDLDKDKDKETLAAPAAAYAELLKIWGEVMPEKPQPRPNNKTLQGKLKTRLKDDYFRDNWQAALRRGGMSSFLRAGSWYDVGWFLKNDDNWVKVLNGKYDDVSKAASNGIAMPTVAPPTKEGNW